MMHHRWLILAVPLFLIAGCGDQQDNDTTASGLTADEMQQLNEAAEMLDTDNRPPLPANTLAQ